MKKKLFALICALTMILSLTACGGTKQYSDLESMKMSQCQKYAQDSLQLAMSLAGDAASVTEMTGMYNKEELAYIYSVYMSNYFSDEIEAELGAFNGLLTTYAQMISDMGGLVSVEDNTASIQGDKVVVSMNVKGNECDGVVTFSFTNDIFSKFIEAECLASTSFSQKLHAAGSNMGTAGLNTLLGMGTVFIMLILISLIISSFGFIGKAGSKKKPAAPAPVAAPTTPEVVEEDVTDDTELVAVIMAAISAYEGNGSTDGYVVRSIKRVNRRR